MLEVKDLNKFYGSKQALENVSLSFGPGEIVGLFGENGAGKTTLMKCILGFIKYRGSVRLDGEPISRKNIARLSFATSEHSFFPDITAKEHAYFFAEHFGTFRQKRFDGLMEFFGLPDNKPIKKFSTGQQNQFEVILALCQGADYILMDEPFAGNDVFNREDFYKVRGQYHRLAGFQYARQHLVEVFTVENVVTGEWLVHKYVVRALALEEKGLSLIDYVKQAYEYRADRVAQAIEQISGSEQQ